MFRLPEKHHRMRPGYRQIDTIAPADRLGPIENEVATDDKDETDPPSVGERDKKAGVIVAD
jgi:hypothetical protein